MKPDPTDVWLTTVAYSHSQSRNTEYSYKKSMQDYCRFAEITPAEILAEYEITTEKTFKRKHANQMLQWIAKLHNENFAPSTIRSLWNSFGYASSARARFPFVKDIFIMFLPIYVGLL